MSDNYTGERGADLDEEIGRAGRGLAQTAPVLMSVVADQARRAADRGAAAAAEERAAQAQRASLTLQEAQTGYLHATAPGWASTASQEDLTSTWVAASGWRDRDPAAAHVTDSVEERLRRDWPQLAAAYDQARSDGLTPIAAMGRAVDERHPTVGADHALRQAGIHDERMATQHLATQDDPRTPLVDEKVEAATDYITDTQRALDLQHQARDTSPPTSTPPAAPLRREQQTTRTR